MTVEDFELQERGHYLFNHWCVRERVPTPFGKFKVTAYMDLEDSEPPDERMVREANELADFARNDPEALLAKIHEHYTIYAQNCPDRLESCNIPLGLKPQQLAPYLFDLTIAVDRYDAPFSPDPNQPHFLIMPRWEEEHQLALILKDGQIEIWER